MADILLKPSNCGMRMSSIDDYIQWVRRQLGHPIVKVELTDEQIKDNLCYALDMFIKYASGQATDEVFYTLMLSAGQEYYTLPEGTVDIFSIDDEGSGTHGINTLFTLENQLYNAGLLDFKNLGSGLTLVTYHLALDFLEVVRRYTTSVYHYYFDPDTRTLKINPPPKNGQLYIQVPGDQNGVYGTETKLINSPGWILLCLKMLKGAATDPEFTIDKGYMKLLNKEWVKQYTLALCKINLGMIRRKYENYASIGNTGIALDGNDLVSDGKEEKDNLEEKLLTQESWEGFDIITGIV